MNVYHLVRWMQTHGRPDTWTRATNTPFFMVFEEQATGNRTYVGFNATSAPLTVEFSDGETLPDVAPRSLGVRVVTP